MRKIRGIFLGILLIISLSVLVCALVYAQSTNPWSASASSSEKNDFTNTQDIYVKSNILCQPFTEIDLYVTDNKDDWSDGNILEDVRGQPDKIELEAGKISLIKIWEKPFPGKYDIVVDCNGNSQYDLGIDQIDSFDGIGFNVEAKKGTGIVSFGENNIGEHSWRYDPENPVLENEMLQLKIQASGEDIDLEEINIKASGSGNDTNLDSLEIYSDENNNGKLDEKDIIIGDSQPAYLQNDGNSTVSLDFILEKDTIKNILVVYVMKQNSSEGEYQLSVLSLKGTGENSGEEISFSGLPLDSGIKTVLSEKTCLGELTLDLEPNPAVINSEIVARISGLTGCAGKEIVLRPNPCGSSLEEQIGSCVVTEGTEGCGISFEAEQRTFHACIDKNNDNDFIDFGEFDFEDLILTQPSPEEIEENETSELPEIEEGNVTEEEIEEEMSITGGVIEELKERFSGASSFFVLLEITLLLILLVMILILFRLKGARVISKSESSKTSSEESEKRSEESEKTE